MSNMSSSEQRASTRRALKPGEWACVDAKCAHINPEFRHTCDNCGKTKPRAKNRIGREIGKDAAEKSKGLFAAEDWACTKCGNINWARRTTCNICNAPKLGDLEVRTGYGGGYMDREDVEYIERQDDDEEFDEFGRKKKRRVGDPGGDQETGETMEQDGEGREGETRETRSRVPAIARDKGTHDEDDEENEDEDEEEDSEDLDKYDLTADPELVAKPLLLTRRVDPASPSVDRASSRASSDCTCSCSGGECSCEDSEEEGDGGRRGEESRDRKGGDSRDTRTGDRTSRDKGSTRERRRSRSRDRGEPRRGSSHRDRR